MKKSRATGNRVILPLFLPVLLLVCVLTLPARAQEAFDATQTEQRLATIRKELDAIARERRRLESERGAASRQLRRADEHVATAARALLDTQAQLDAQRASLTELGTRRQRMQAQIAQLRTELARLLRAAHAAGEIAPLKQLLAHDQASDLTQATVYQRYLQRHRHQRIEAALAELASLDTLEQDLAERQNALEATHLQQQQRTRQLERERRARANTRASLDARYASQHARERALGQDIRALEELLSKLRAATPDTGGNTRLQPGQLAWPLSGQLLHRFGQRLADGRSSTGLLIDAPLGAPVHAVADGAVVFSEWMTGYGMLLIIDHGNGQMSLYAHNEALLKQVGDSVRRGEAIASVGHSGGQNASALYFELRRDGQPVNPEQWLQAR